MSLRQDEQILEQLNEIATRIRTPAEQARFEAVMARLLESKDPEDRWIAGAVMLTLYDQGDAQYAAEEEGRHWDVLVVGRLGDTRAFHFAASEDVQADFINFSRRHDGVWGERLGSGCLPESAALRIAELLNETVDGSQK